jgi:type VI secretion system protein VasI
MDLARKIAMHEPDSLLVSPAMELKCRTAFCLSPTARQTPDLTTAMLALAPKEVEDMGTRETRGFHQAILLRASIRNSVMRVLLTCLFPLTIISVPASADITADIARCAAIESPAERLACYDALAKRLGLEGGKKVSTSDAPGVGKWRTSTETSPIDDSRNVYLRLDAEESIPSMLGTVRPTLYIRCKENRTELYISWGVYLGLDTTTLLTRLDSEKAKSATWHLSTDNEATFYPGSPISFIRNLLQHNTLLVQVTPYGESPVMVTFDLRGLEEAVKPLQEACNWK